MDRRYVKTIIKASQKWNEKQRNMQLKDMQHQAIEWFKNQNEEKRHIWLKEKWQHVINENEEQRYMQLEDMQQQAGE